MNRRSFFKVLGAIGAGVALRSVPVLGETFSELTVPAVFPGVDAPVELLDMAYEHHVLDEMARVGAANYIPEIWSKSLMRSVGYESYLSKLVERNYEEALESMGDTIHIPRVLL